MPMMKEDRYEDLPEERSDENATRLKLYPHPYYERKGCLCLGKGTPGEARMSLRRLCNFLAWITEEITLDDGIEPTKRIRLGGLHSNGRRLPELEIAAKDLPNFQWMLDKWGPDCVVDVGSSNQTHIRNAIQLTARYALKKTVYSVTGWKQLEDGWHFLLPGNQAYEVQLDGKLTGYRGEDHWDVSDIAQTFSMIDLALAPKKVLLPLLAFVFLTPLCQFLKEAGCDPKFVLFLLGRTGSRKSTLAALFLSSFGEFTASSLPLSFQDTANSILHQLFSTKDVLTCVDDFHPDGAGGVAKMTATAQAVMRAYGDRVGKGRLTDQSTPMAVRPPQGNAILTGEFAPDIGESGTARYLAVELHEGDVDLEVLSLFQKEASAGLLRRTMFAYTEWMRKSFLLTEAEHGLWVKKLEETFRQYRSEFIAKGIQCHGRVPEMAALMRLGLEMGFRFIVESGAVGQNEVEPLLGEFESILAEMAAEQAGSIALDKPSHVFVGKLYSLIETGAVALLPRNGEALEKPANFIGYEDADYLYLNVDAAHKAVKRLCADQGELFAVSSRGLMKDLAEEGLILPGKNQNTRTVKIGNHYPRMLWLNKAKAKEVVGGME